MGTTSADRPPARDASAVLFGRTRRRVLGWLLGHPDERFYLRQIVRQSGAAQGGAVQRELQMLTQAGILRRTTEGRHVYFQANRESPIYPELHALLLKTAGIVDVVRAARPALSRFQDFLGSRTGPFGCLAVLVPSRRRTRP